MPGRLDQRIVCRGRVYFLGNLRGGILLRDGNCRLGAAKGIVKPRSPGTLLTAASSRMLREQALQANGLQNYSLLRVDLSCGVKGLVQLADCEPKRESNLSFILGDGIKRGMRVEYLELHTENSVDEKAQHSSLRLARLEPSRAILDRQ